MPGTVLAHCSRCCLVSCHCHFSCHMGHTLAGSPGTMLHSIDSLMHKMTDTHTSACSAQNMHPSDWSQDTIRKTNQSRSWMILCLQNALYGTTYKWVPYSPEVADSRPITWSHKLGDICAREQDTVRTNTNSSIRITLISSSAVCVNWGTIHREHSHSQLGHVS